MNTPEYAGQIYKSIKMVADAIIPYARIQELYLKDIFLDIDELRYELSNGSHSIVIHFAMGSEMYSMVLNDGTKIQSPSVVRMIDFAAGILRCS